MSNFNTNKINGSTLEADEWNQLQDLENLVSTSGINPDTSLLNQIPQAVSNYVAIANFYTDNGIVNAYNLTPINNFKSPTQYITGMLVRFRTTNANTGASTVNVASLGVKNIKKADGTTDLVAGDIATGTDIELRYDGTNFLLNSVVLASASATTQGIQYLNKPITISNNIADANNDIDFSAGNFIFSDKTGSATVSAMTKQLDAIWSAGNNAGGLFSGSKANNSTYHLYAIYNPTTQVSDFGFLLGVAGTTPDPTSVLPAGYTKFKLIASVITDASGNIRSGKYFFDERGNYIFKYNTTVIEINSATTTSFAGLQNITTPAGLNVNAYCVLQLAQTTGGTANNSYSTVQDFNKTTITSYGLGCIKVPDYTNLVISKISQILTNTSSQVYYATEAFGGTGSTNSLYTEGWEQLIN